MNTDEPPSFERKPPVTSTSRGYHNEVVFKSALSLARSRPQSRAGFAPPKSKIRHVGLIFAAICLFVAGVIVGRRPATPSASGNSTFARHETTPSEPWQNGPDAAVDTSGKLTPVTDAPSPIVDASPSAPTLRGTPEYVAPPDSSAVVIITKENAPTSADSSAPRSGSPAVPAPASSALAASVPAITLRGTLQPDAADAGPAVEVEFVLHRRNESVTGLVRYFSAGERVTANAVSGRIVDRTVKLRETSLIWHRNPAPASFPTDLTQNTARATFTFELPGEIPAGSFTGNWSRGTVAGSLRLLPSLPW